MISKVHDPDLFLTLLEGLFLRYQLYKSYDELENGTVDAFWECLTMSNVPDCELFLTYFSRSNKTLESLLATYQPHISN